MLITLHLAFGPFILLGIFVSVVRRRDVAAEAEEERTDDG
jgi:hypothetical protein